MLSSNLNYLDNIVDKQILDNRAVLAVEYEYVFSKALTPKARKFFTSDFKSPNEINKLKKWVDSEQNSLNVCLLFTFEKDATGAWKILYFSRDEFDNTGFEDFISKYENSVITGFNENMDV